MARASIVYPAGRAGVVDRVATAALGLYARATDPVPLPPTAPVDPDPTDSYLTPDGVSYYATPTGDEYYAQPL